MNLKPLMILPALWLAACAETPQETPQDARHATDRVIQPGEPDPMFGPTVERRTLQANNGSDVTVWWDREDKSRAYVRWRHTPMMVNHVDVAELVEEATGCERSFVTLMNRKAPPEYREGGIAIRCT